MALNDKLALLALATEKLSQQEVAQMILAGADVNARDSGDATPLMLALAIGAPVVDILLKAGADPDAHAKDGVTALMLAAGFNPDESVTERLVQSGAEVNAKDNRGRTPLMYAARKNTLAVLLTLLQAGAPISERDWESKSALDYLEQNANLHDSDEARNLLAHPVRQSPQLQQAQQPQVTQATQPGNLFAAAKDGSIDTVTQLIASGADVNMQRQDGWTPLMFAAGYNSPEVVQLLLKSGASVSVQDQRGWTPLMVAARVSQSVEVIKALVDAGSDLSAKSGKGNTAFGLLVQNDRLKDNAEARKLLTVAKTVPVQQEQQSQEQLAQARAKQSAKLFAAAKDGSVDDIAQLIASGVDVNIQRQDGWTPLMFAAGYNSPEVVQLLLKSGASVQAQDQRGWTPLMVAARVSQSVAVIKALVDAGSNLTAKSGKGNTAFGLLMQNEKLKDTVEANGLLAVAGAANVAFQPDNFFAAAKEGTVSTVAQLVASGANVNMQRQDGWTPLMFAAGYNSPDVVQLLLQLGADVHAQDQRGWTPLMFAARISSHVTVIQALIDAGADLNVKTSQGNTASAMLTQNENLKNNVEARKLLAVTAAQP